MKIQTILTLDLETEEEKEEDSRDQFDLDDFHIRINVARRISQRSRR